MNKSILIITAIAIVIAVVAISFSGYMTSYAPLPQPESPPSEQPETPTSPPQETPPQEQPPEQPPQSPPQPQPQIVDMEIRNYVFSPTTITIKVGDSVRWTNRDSASHTATADDNSFDTGYLSSGQSKTIIFDKAGTYNYHCTPHSWMKAKIVVE